MKNLDAYLVGGAVRDELLGRSVQDRDWVVVGSSVRQMKKLGFKQIGKDFPVFLHPKTKEEYALARTERKRGRGHRGFAIDANPEVTLVEDLSRRDLTINAMAQSLSGDLIDPFDGARDIESRSLRHVSEAFVEDPLRVFRVARLAAELPDFEVVDETNALMASICSSGELETLPAERVWQEMQKALAAPQPERFFAALVACGGLADWLPELVGREFGFTDGDAIDRFAELPVDEEELDRLARRLKTPLRFRQAALHYRRYREALSEWRSCEVGRLVDALVELKVVHQLDAFERLAGLLDRHGAEDVAGLMALAVGLAAVSVDDSTTGAAFGEALRAARIRWVERQRER
jgi:tRNA nucleotidyltransferase (CCA-adding enzyme)